MQIWLDTINAYSQFPINLSLCAQWAFEVAHWSSCYIFFPQNLSSASTLREWTMPYFEWIWPSRHSEDYFTVSYRRTEEMCIAGDRMKKTRPKQCPTVNGKRQPGIILNLLWLAIQINWMLLRTNLQRQWWVIPFTFEIVHHVFFFSDIYFFFTIIYRYFLHY